MGSLDWLSTDNKEALEILPIEERALMPNGLPHELSIKDIAALSDHENKLKQEMTIKTLVDLCKAGRLHYYGDINGWSYREDMINPYPKVDGSLPMAFFLGELVTLYACSYDCLIHRDDFKLYLQSVNIWPVNGLLANWWTELEQQAEAVKDQEPKDKQSKTYQERSDDFQTWIDEIKPSLNEMTKKQILAELRKRDPHLWVGGFEDWWKWQDIYKAKRGRKTG